MRKMVRLSMGSRSNRYSDMLIDAVVDKVCMGCTVDSLSRELGISNWTIRLWCQRAGVRPRHGRPRKDE